MWVLCGFIAHHCGGKGVAGGSDEDAGELGKEEVGVVLYGVVEPTLAEAEEGGVLFGGGLDMVCG